MKKIIRIVCTFILILAFFASAEFLPEIILPLAGSYFHKAFCDNKGFFFDPDSHNFCFL